jgi:hypothetical protein
VKIDMKQDSAGLQAGGEETLSVRGPIQALQIVPMLHGDLLLGPSCEDVGLPANGATVTVGIRRLVRNPTAGAVTGDFAGIPNKSGPVAVDLLSGSSEIKLQFDLPPVKSEHVKLTVYFHPGGFDPKRPILAVGPSFKRFGHGRVSTSPIAYYTSPYSWTEEYDL